MKRLSRAIEWLASDEADAEIDHAIQTAVWVVGWIVLALATATIAVQICKARGWM